MGLVDLMGGGKVCCFSGCIWGFGGLGYVCGVLWGGFLVRSFVGIGFYFEYIDVEV